MLKRRWLRWPLEAAFIFGFVPLVLVIINQTRECREPNWNLPVNCPTDWISGIVLWLLVFTIIVEIVVWVRGRRPCPRCGKRVTNGRMDCPHCGFDFSTIGAAA